MGSLASSLMGQASKQRWGRPQNTCTVARPADQVPTAMLFTSGCLEQRVKITLEWPPHKEAMPAIDLQVTMRKGPGMLLYAFNTSTCVKELETSLVDIESSRLAVATQ